MFSSKYDGQVGWRGSGYCEVDSSMVEIVAAFQLRVIRIFPQRDWL
jgi:hypothetical protein